MMTFFPRIYRPDGSATKTGIDLAIQTLQAAKAANGAMYAPTSLTAADDQELPDLLNPAADPAVLGSTIGVDTNDPVVLPRTDGRDYIFLPTANYTLNHVSLPVNSANVPAGDTTLRWHGIVDNLSVQTEGAGWQAGNGMNFWFAAGGIIRGHATPSGGSGIFTSTFSHGIASGEEIYIEMRRVKSTGVITFHTSRNGTDWTLVGTSAAIGAGSDLNAGGSFRVGFTNIAANRASNSKVFSCRAGATGEDPVAVIDASENGGSQTSWTASSGQTVTVARATTGLKTAIVTRPVLVLDDTDDYLQLPASATPTFTATTGKHTVVVAFRHHAATWPNWIRIYSAESAPNNGLSIYGTSGGTGINALVGGTTTSSGVSAGSYTPGALHVTAAVVDNGTLYHYLDTAGISGPDDISGVGTITFAPPKIGRIAIGASIHSNIEFVEFLDFPGEALTEPELDALSEYLKAGAYL